ncbi:MAG TPA: 16S rRNA (guanine(966)-N(2))-methyltransferase RsmD [Allosphingosinicella sp.]|jgi:16S rRNA (guanine966-N2)-methyltransferase|nr:16S rRNA (guanine(966)-N(2))-methyltransferase RsmD [Allosphingosinicella sp.]
MRIISGAWRGRPLLSPQGQDTRPTSDRAREGLFSMLASRLGSFEGLEVADLFAGTGALGLEALSRGAARCTFVERDANAIKVLKRNLEKLGALDRAEVRAQAAEKAAFPLAPCDLVLMDPPYKTGLAQKALDRIAAPGWLAPGAWVSVELSSEDIALPEGLTLDADRRFGKATIMLLRRES